MQTLKMLVISQDGSSRARGYALAGFNTTHVTYSQLETDFSTSLTGLLTSHNAIHITNISNKSLVEEIKQSGKHYVMENPSGPVILCGTMFKLGSYQHIGIESSFDFSLPPHLHHNDDALETAKSILPICTQYIGRILYQRLSRHRHILGSKIL